MWAWIILGVAVAALLYWMADKIERLERKTEALESDLGALTKTSGTR